MGASGRVEEAVRLLQELGLKEYEAECFVGLTRLNTGTARELSERTEVPRTRVYDAIRVLQSKGLVEVHHSSPQQFRAVPLAEAIETLRDQYEDRIQRIHNTLATLENADVDDREKATMQEVWSISGREAIENRTEELIETAADEIVFILCDESLLTGDLNTALNDTANGVNLLVGVLTESLQIKVQDAVPDATTFISGLEWLRGENGSEDDTGIGRLLLVDRSTILVSSIDPETKEEQAIFGEGFENGLVVIARRLMAQGLLNQHDPLA